MSDVYAGHDLVPRRDRTDDWRVVIPFQSGQERLPSPQRDQGAICSALGEHPQDPSERGAGPGALTPVVRTGSHAPPLENGSSPSHRHRGARSATGPRAAAVRATVPGVQRGRAPPVPPPHPARLRTLNRTITLISHYAGVARRVRPSSLQNKRALADEHLVLI